MKAAQERKKVGREKEYMRDYMRDRRMVGFDQTKKDNMKSTMKRRERKNQLVEYKGGACAFCGGVFDGVCFDFHHLNPSKKKYDIAAEMLKIDISELKKELKKCIMLCANCHRVCHKIMAENCLSFLTKQNAIAHYREYKKV